MVVRVVCDVEEAHALLERARVGDFLVEIWQHRNVHGVAAGEHPVFAEGIAVASVNGLDGVTQLVHEAHKVLELPTLGAEGLPDLQVVLEWSEGNERVVRRAAAEDFGARVPDV